MSEVFDALFLGLVQGLTEFLPVSSSGHLALLQALLGWDDPQGNLAFNVTVHLGSLAAVVVFLHKELWNMFTSRPRLFLVVIVATLPLAAIALGTPVRSAVEEVSSNLVIVGGLLVFSGIVLAAVKDASGHRRAAADLPVVRALVVGAAQALAILPGVSRSGMTLAAGLKAGLEREEAVRFAFLLAVPAIGGAVIFMVVDGGLKGGVSVAPMATGAVMSFASSLLAMKLLMGAVRGRHLGWLAVYCVCAGALAIGLQLLS